MRIIQLKIPKSRKWKLPLIEENMRHFDAKTVSKETGDDQLLNTSKMIAKEDIKLLDSQYGENADCPY